MSKIYSSRIKFIDYLKCDIEGGEYLAFKPKELLLKVKYLMMELHTIENIPPEDTDLFKYIKKNFDTEKFSNFLTTRNWDLCKPFNFLYF